MFLPFHLTKISSKHFKSIFLLLFIFFCGSSFSQKAQIKNRFKEHFKYVDSNLKVPNDSLNKLARLWMTVTSEKLNENEKKVTFGELIQTMVNVQNVSKNYTKAAINSLAGQYKRIENLKIPPALKINGALKNVTYNNVKTIGNGENNIILLSDIFTDVSIYSSFIEAHKSEYTFHLIDLPGVGNVAPLELPEQRIFDSTPWFSRIENAVVSYIKNNNISSPIIIGSWGSGYLAHRIGNNNAQIVKGVVLLNSPVDMLSYIDRGNPTGFNNTVESRQNYLKSRIPNIFPSANIERRRLLSLGFATFYTSDVNKLNSLADAQSKIQPKVLTQYVNELFAKAYRTDLQNSKVPVLSITSMHEPDGRTGSTGFQMLANEWQKIDADTDNPNFNHIVFEDTRTYVSLDAPQELGIALKQFMKGKPINIAKVPNPVNRRYQPSARNKFQGFIGSTPIEIDYGSPQAKGREIFGQLVPYDAPWRAGANNTTKIKFYHDVILSGVHIEKGSYGFYIVPNKEGDWEAILTKYDISAAPARFTYDSKYIYKKVNVHVSDIPKEEYLRYFVEQNTSVDGVLGLIWGKKRMEIPVEATANVNNVEGSDLSIVEKRNWKSIHKEDNQDGNNKNRADAKELFYSLDTPSNMLWFKIKLENTINYNNIGFNIVIDKDQNQNTGANWWGQHNANFQYDCIGTFYVTKSNKGKYVGTIGFSDYYYLTDGIMNKNSQNNIQFVPDEKNNLLYFGVPLKNIDEDMKFNFIIAVGTSRGWNDDLPNKKYFSFEKGLISLKKFSNYY